MYYLGPISMKTFQLKSILILKWRMSCHGVTSNKKTVGHGHIFKYCIMYKHINQQKSLKVIKKRPKRSKRSEGSERSYGTERS